LKTALVILSWLKSATEPSRFLILPTVLTIGTSSFFSAGHKPGKSARDVLQ
jgi:hypothetical protein